VLLRFAYLTAVNPCPPTAAEELFRTSQYPNLPTLLQHTGSPGFANLRAAELNGMSRRCDISACRRNL